jgi:hypothetical protein
VFPRCRKDGLNVAHVVNITYDDVRKKNIPRTNLKISLPENLFNRNFDTATVHACGREPVKVPVEASDGKVSVVLDEVALWSIIAFEYWQ